MNLARVVGNATTTVCHPALRGVRFLLCELLDGGERPTGRVLLCSDWQGAGIGDAVLITSDGEAASRHTNDKSTPLRNVVVGLVDTFETEGA